MPSLKNKSKQYLFKKKLNIRTKSKGELLRESFIMLIIGLFLFLINYLIPKKIELVNSFKNNFIEIISNLMEILFYSFEILIVLFICFSLFIFIFLIIGIFNRIFKVMNKKTRKIRVR